MSLKSDEVRKKVHCLNQLLSQKVIRLTNHSHRLTIKTHLWHQVHQPFLHPSKMLVLSCILSDKSTNLLTFLLVVPYLDSFHQGLIAVEYQFSDTSFVFANQFLYVITVDEQWYMFLHSVIAMAYAASGLFFSNICGIDFLCHRSSSRSRAMKSSLSLGSKLTSCIRYLEYSSS